MRGIRLDLGAQTQRTYDGACTRTRGPHHARPERCSSLLSTCAPLGALPAAAHFGQRILDNGEPKRRQFLETPPAARHPRLLLGHPLRIERLLGEKAVAANRLATGV